MTSSSEAGYKAQICYFWSIGCCKFGDKCKFSHGIEEQSRHLFQSNATTGSAEAATAASTNSSINATPAAEVAATTSSTNLPIKATLAAATVASTNSSVKPEQPIRGSTTSNIGSNWSPQDDGIEIKPLPSSTTGNSPSRDEVDEFMEGVLYGPKTKERLKGLPKLLPD